MAVTHRRNKRTTARGNNNIGGKLAQSNNSSNINGSSNQKRNAFSGGSQYGRLKNIQDSKDECHNFGKPCCHLARDIVRDLFDLWSLVEAQQQKQEEENSGGAERTSKGASLSASQKKQGQPRTSCLSVLLQRFLEQEYLKKNEQQNPNENPYSLQAPGAASKKKKKKKRKKPKKSTEQDTATSSPEVQGDRKTNDSERGEQKSDKTSEVSTELACEEMASANDCNHSQLPSTPAITAPPPPPPPPSPHPSGAFADEILRTYFDMEKPLDKAMSIQTVFSEKRTLPQFLSNLPSCKAFGGPSNSAHQQQNHKKPATNHNGKKNTSSKRQTLRGTDQPSPPSPASTEQDYVIVGHLQDILHCCNAIQCPHCQHGVKALLKRYLAPDGEKQISIVLPPLEQDYTAAKGGRLAIPVVTGTTQEENEDADVEEAFNYELMEEGGGTTQSALMTNGHANAKKEVAILDLSVIPRKKLHGLPTGHSGTATNKFDADWADTYSTCLLTIPRSLLQDPVQCQTTLLQLVQTVLLPLGHDPKLVLEKVETVQKEKVIQNKTSPEEVKFSWRDEVWCNNNNTVNPNSHPRDQQQQQHQSKAFSMPIKGNDVIRKTILTLQKVMGEMRVAAWDEYKKLMDERSLRLEEEHEARRCCGGEKEDMTMDMDMNVDFPQCNQMLVVDDALNEWMVSTTDLLLKLAQYSFSLYRPTVQNGAFQICQQMMKKLWQTYDDTLTLFIPPLLEFRACQIFATRQEGEGGGVGEVPQLFENASLRQAMADWLTRKLHILDSWHATLEETCSFEVNKSLNGMREQHVNGGGSVPPTTHASTFEEVLCFVAATYPMHSSSIAASMEETKQGIMYQRSSFVSRTINQPETEYVKKEQDVKGQKILGIIENDFVCSSENGRIKALEKARQIAKAAEKHKESTNMAAMEAWIGRFSQEWEDISKAQKEAKKVFAQKRGGLLHVQPQGVDCNGNGYALNRRETSIDMQRKHFVEASKHSLDYISHTASLAIKKWRLLLQFEAQTKHLEVVISRDKKETLDGLKSSSKEGATAVNATECRRAAQHRLNAIAAGLIFCWMEQCCDEWNAEETQRELLEGYSMGEGLYGEETAKETSTKTKKKGQGKKKMVNSGASKEAGVMTGSPAAEPKNAQRSEASNHGSSAAENADEKVVENVKLPASKQAGVKSSMDGGKLESDHDAITLAHHAEDQPDKDSDHKDDHEDCSGKKNSVKASDGIVENLHVGDYLPRTTLDSTTKLNDSSSVMSPVCPETVVEDECSSKEGKESEGKDAVLVSQPESSVRKDPSCSARTIETQCNHHEEIQAFLAARVDAIFEKSQDTLPGGTCVDIVYLI